MKKEEILKKVTLSLNKLKLKGRQHSPEILLITGTITGVATVIVACKSTLKLPHIIDDTKNDIDSIHQVSESTEYSEEEYSEDDRKKDLAVVYARTGLQIVKLYIPAALLGTVSLTSFFASNDILKKRNMALASAYAVIDKGFKEYRERVVDRFGDKVDNELRYNIKAKEFDTVEVNEDGEAITKRETVDVVDSNVDMGYDKWFDENCKGWNKEANIGRYFLVNQQRIANDLLQSKGYMFLNDVYDMLGLPRTREGQEIGWIYDPDDPNRSCWIDFGIIDAKKEVNRNFVNGYEPYALLHFNPDGPILSVLDKEARK